MGRIYKKKYELLQHNEKNLQTLFDETNRRVLGNETNNLNNNLNNNQNNNNKCQSGILFF